MRCLNPSKFLQELEPTRKLLCFTRFDSSIGLAVSDPYLSLARPLSKYVSVGGTHLSATLKKIQREEDIGGVVLGRAISGMSGVSLDDSEVLKEQGEGLELFRTLPEFNALPCTFSDVDGERVDIERELQDNLLWDSLELTKDEFDEDSSPSKRDPAIHSALSLQLWLDEHCGGWQNTFG